MSLLEHYGNSFKPCWTESCFNFKKAENSSQRSNLRPKNYTFMVTPRFPNMYECSFLQYVSKKLQHWSFVKLTLIRTVSIIPESVKLKDVTELKIVQNLLKMNCHGMKKVIFSLFFVLLSLVLFTNIRLF